MPRYFFNVHDGADLLDDEGTELADLSAARKHAVCYAGALLMDTANAFWDDADWSMDVKDEGGLCLFTLHLLLTQAPATMGADRTSGR